jgi:hypothetical protein
MISEFTPTNPEVLNALSQDDRGRSALCQRAQVGNHVHTTRIPRNKIESVCRDYLAARTGSTETFLAGVP